MRKLQHPRLIQLYDAIDTGKQIYVVLELITGGELFERVIDDDFVLTERSCAVFMRQICEGIEFVHAQNILHLDMKPENILCLTKEGNRIKIIDFGLARQYDPTKKLQVLFGTPEFVAPEVVNFDQIGFGTDMWSIGVICYVLLSGLSPFMGDTDVETMANVTIAKYDFDHEAFTDISEDAKDFIRSLLIKDKEKRLSASRCREHRWLVQKKLPSSTSATPKVVVKPEVSQPDVNLGRREELDMTKDNLRLFVERWREHPDSPYMIEVEAPQGRRLVSDLEQENTIEVSSLRCGSPSPCGSLCSSVSEIANSPADNTRFLLPPTWGFPFERRASDGTCSRDASAQIVLAEEIIRLSEHLRSLAAASKVGPGSQNPQKLNDQDKVNPSTSVEKDADKGKSDKVKQISPNRLRVPGMKTDDRQVDEVSGNVAKTLGKKERRLNDKMDVESSGSAKENRKEGKREKSVQVSSSKTKLVEQSEEHANEISEKLSTITRQRQLKGTTFNRSRTVENDVDVDAGKVRSGSAEKNFKLDGDTVKKSPKVVVEGGGSSTSVSDLVDSRNADKKFNLKADTFLRLEDFDTSDWEDLTPPWRKGRVKRRFGETCRDVPRISTLRDLHQDRNLDEPTSTKNLLLQLLEEWGDITRPSGVGRKSVSVDWGGEESVARRSMNSLAEYFQSEQQKSAQSVTSIASPLAHR
ncbi:probable serine/threonine-protein kinase MARK-C isoform X2 [Orussus abietinus]|nr:probable serine/threonine-protein kinase MARK-C isoform X2 [Orussus abietinus]